MWTPSTLKHERGGFTFLPLHTVHFSIKELESERLQSHSAFFRGWGAYCKTHFSCIAKMEFHIDCTNLSQYINHESDTASTIRFCMSTHWYTKVATFRIFCRYQKMHQRSCRELLTVFSCMLCIGKSMGWATWTLTTAIGEGKVTDNAPVHRSLKSLELLLWFNEELTKDCNILSVRTVFLPSST